MKKQALFAQKSRGVIGMIHLPPTMGFEGWSGMETTLNKAIRDLGALEKGGADGALIENDGDHPCKVKGDFGVIVPMTVVAFELARMAKISLGVEVLLNDPKASLTIAKACGLNFIRSDYFVDRMTREGYGEFEINPKAVMEYRSQIGASEVFVLTDVQVKYASMIEQKSLSESVDQAVSEGSDGIIVSGTKTGAKPATDDLKEVKSAAAGRVPVIIGSGLSSDNASELMKYADWAIVGSSIKTDGAIDVQKVRKLVKIVKESRHVSD